MAEPTAPSSTLVIHGALFANLGIAVAKFIAAAFTGSSSMLSEGIHSAVDSTNQLLLLYGQRRAARPADAARPFGYGRELYFWSFVVAIMIFTIGAAASAYEGYLHIMAPEPLRDPLIAYVVLGVAFLFEGASWVIAMRDLAREKGTLGWWQTVRRSKNPTTLAVVFEDSAALAGLLVAAAGIWASHRWNDPRLDGVASLVIGTMLAVVAVLLARETKGLLIGEPADDARVARIRAVVSSYPGIERVHHVRSVHTAPDQIFVAVSADFDDAMSMGAGERLIAEIEAALRAEISELASIYIRPTSSGTEEGRAV